MVWRRLFFPQQRANCAAAYRVHITVVPTRFGEGVLLSPEAKSLVVIAHFCNLIQDVSLTKAVQDQATCAQRVLREMELYDTVNSSSDMYCMSSMRGEESEERN